MLWLATMFSFSTCMNYLHRYLGLIVSLQILLWSLGGFFMAFWDFSDLYIGPPPKPIQWEQLSLSSTELHKYLPENTQVKTIRLVQLGDDLYYLVERIADKPLLLDQQGEVQSPLSPELATTIARSEYTGQGQLQSIDLLSSSKGNYVSSVPVYRARFNDQQATEIYLDPDSGSLLGRRKAIWRWYNRFWNWHLMKYTPHQQSNKIFLLGFAVLAFLVSLSGLWKFFK